VTEEEMLALIERYEAGAVREPDGQNPAGELWWSLLQFAPEERAATLRRCYEPGWVTPQGVGYLASVLELPAEASSWDDVTRRARELKAALVSTLELPAGSDSWDDILREVERIKAALPPVEEEPPPGEARTSGGDDGARVDGE
jgi:hypothetical protein